MAAAGVTAAAGETEGGDQRRAVPLTAAAGVIAGATTARE